MKLGNEGMSVGERRALLALIVVINIVLMWNDLGDPFHAIYWVLRVIVMILVVIAVISAIGSIIHVMSTQAVHDYDEDEI